MLLAMGKDVRVILIKLADRVHNMRTLDHLPIEKQILTAQETLESTLPVASLGHLLGSRRELEDSRSSTSIRRFTTSSSATSPKRRSDREKYIAGGDLRARQELEAEGIEAEVPGRPKHFYSASTRRCKVRTCSMTRSMTWSRFASWSIRARECYETLGIVHSQWKPVPGRFKDYIALPKAEHVPVATYKRDRALRRAHRNPDPYP